MKAKVIALVFSIVLLLAGCSGPGGSAGVTLHVVGGQIGFEVDDQGKIIIPQSQVIFWSQAGAAEAVVTGYEVRFVNVSGNPIPGLEPMRNSGAVSIVVPRGVRCEEDAIGPCTLLNGGWPEAMPSEAHNLATLPGEVAAHMVINDHYPIYAIISFTVTQGGSTYAFESEMTVTNPFGAE